MGKRPPHTPGTDLAGYLTRYPLELTFGEEEPAAVFSRYHTDDFVLRNDGIPLDRERLLAHVRAGRRNATQIHVDVHDALISDARVAARYTLTAVMRRGQVIVTDIHMFGELAPDGRLHRAEQLSRNVSAQADG
jgi:phosphodiesterase/alkaline phosphatase D-like protein